MLTEKDLKHIEKDSTELVKWIVARDITVNEAFLVLLSVVTSIAKQYNIKKDEVDEIYRTMWQAVQVHDLHDKTHA